jgi:hypothetical protein
MKACKDDQTLGRQCKDKDLTYFMRGRRVRDQTIALTPPITSSFDGASLEGLQIPFKTYRGEVPRSEYMIPLWNISQQMRS